MQAKRHASNIEFIASRGIDRHFIKVIDDELQYQPCHVTNLLSSARRQSKSYYVDCSAGKWPGLWELPSSDIFNLSYCSTLVKYKRSPYKSNGKSSTGVKLYKMYHLPPSPPLTNKLRVSNKSPSVLSIRVPTALSQFVVTRKVSLVS